MSGAFFSLVTGLSMPSMCEYARVRFFLHWEIFQVKCKTYSREFCDGMLITTKIDSSAKGFTNGIVKILHYILMKM